MTDVVDLLAARLARVGIDLVGATSVTAYDARVAEAARLARDAPDARGVLVLGNGGTALWEAFRADAPVAGPHDPLDRFVARAVDEATYDVPGARCRYPSDPRLDFRLLGELAGLGSPSLLGLLVHPTYGPWMALRAAVLVPDEVRAPRPADGFDPCPTCVERPCIAACPVGAIGPRGWDPPACSAHRLADESHCASACTARIACVYGRAHVHQPEALAYHQAAARRAMAAYASAARKA